MNTSTGLKWVEIMYLAVPVKSKSVTVLAREVPFNIKIISFPYAGMDLFNPMGSVINNLNKDKT